MRLALSAGEVRSHLRQVCSEESALIEGYLLAAQQDVEIQCERAITAAKFRIQLPRFPYGGFSSVHRLPFQHGCTTHNTDGSAIQLMHCPVLAIDSISYYDTNNAAQAYTTFNLFTDDEPALLRPALDTLWPSTYDRANAVTITFWAGSIIPLTVDVSTDIFTSTTGYPFADDDPVIISKSGNNNAAIGQIAAIPSGLTEQTTYYVRDSTGTTFKLSATVGGVAISLDEPSADGSAVDLLFAGEIDPYHRLALLQMTAKAFGERCPEGGCICTAEDFEGNPTLRRLKWRAPVEFV